MKVGLALEVDTSINYLAEAVTSLDAKLDSYFADRAYGAGIDNLFIGVILTSPESSHLHPVRSLKFRRRSRFQSMATRLSVDLKNVVEYDARPDFETIRGMSVSQAKSYLSQVLADSLSAIEDQLPRFPDFDFQGFCRDFLDCIDLSDHS